MLAICASSGSVGSGEIAAGATIPLVGVVDRRPERDAKELAFGARER